MISTDVLWVVQLGGKLVLEEEGVSGTRGDPCFMSGKRGEESYQSKWLMGRSVMSLGLMSCVDRPACVPKERRASGHILY